MHSTSLAAVISLILVLTFTNSHIPVRCLEQPNENPRLLIWALAEIADEYDYFFTIEESWLDHESQNIFEIQWVQRTGRAKGLEEELRHLQRFAPTLTFRVNTQNPRIIHIIDSRLLSQPKYGLNIDIPKLDFSGKLDDMLTEFSKKGLLISQPTGGDISEGLGRDLYTVIEAKGENISVRDALSLFIPLQDRPNILWTARTRFGQEEISWVRMSGPKRFALPRLYLDEGSR